MENGGQEKWSDTVIRVVEGIMSIRMSHYKQNGIRWDQMWWSALAERMAEYIFEMKFLPPGRGLWAMGSEYVYERGSAALQNCGYTEVTTLSQDAAWAMDMLMVGVGIGFGTQPLVSNSLPKYLPSEDTEYLDVIPDTREGWIRSVFKLIDSYEEPDSPTIHFDYSQIRPAGELIKGFGGLASGPVPLQELHERLRTILHNYVTGQTSSTRLIADVFNAIGCCVVAGNVRRSAELATGSINDTEFLNLKNYSLNPDRANIGWMSNNSVVLSESEHFDLLPSIAERIKDNGEPGVINLINVQKYGRYGKHKEDRATGFNPCVTGDTRILTRSGYQRIDSLVGQSVEVWNGERWSLVTPRITGTDQPLLKISFSDGGELTTTPYHGFMLSDSYTSVEPTKVEAKDLEVGDRLWKYQFPVVEFGEEVDLQLAYTQGVYAGDGHLDKVKGSLVWLYGEKQDLVDNMSLRNQPWKQIDKDRTMTKVQAHSNDKTFVPLGWGKDARLAWLAGLLDTDGCQTVDGSLQVTSVNRSFLNEVRLLLTTLGCQGKISKGREPGIREMPDGVGGTKEYQCKATWRINIAASSVVVLRELGLDKYLNRINVSNTNPVRNGSRYVTVKEIVEAGTADTVYCFDEPINHTGVFEGYVTSQCAEQPLEDKELCCLVEVFPTRCSTTAELFEAFHLATIYASTVTLLPTHSTVTNNVMQENRRIGVSVSGVADWLDATHMSHVHRMLDYAYENVVIPTNQKMALEAGIPESIRVTTVKPSGTISNLPGVSPGMHHPVFRYGIRRMRVSEQSPLVDLLVASGVPNEPDAYSSGTLVFEFPLEMGAGVTRSVDEVSIWEQASIAAFLQRVWSDNAVSNTLTFNPSTEGDQVERVLTTFAPLVKSMSMLPNQAEQQSYVQAPYERISREEWRERMRKIKQIDWSSFGGSDGMDSRFCDGEECIVEF